MKKKTFTEEKTMFSEKFRMVAYTNLQDFDQLRCPGYQSSLISGAPGELFKVPEMNYGL